MAQKMTLRRLAAALGLRAAADAPREKRENRENREDREEVVAVLVPSPAGFRLRAVPDVPVTDSAARIYRTRDGRIDLDWHAAS